MLLEGALPISSHEDRLGPAAMTDRSCMLTINFATTPWFGGASIEGRRERRLVCARSFVPHFPPPPYGPKLFG